MRDESRFDGLHVALARTMWSQAPIARLYFDPDGDALTVELVPAEAADELLVHDHLLVEFDGTDPGALPTAVTLTGVRAAPGSLAAEAAREFLGAELWAAATALVASGSEQADVELPAAEVAPRQEVWRGGVKRLELRRRRVIGVEFVPGWVYAVLVDGESVVLDEQGAVVEGNEPADVVAAVAGLVDTMAARHPRTEAGRCPIGLQLGGPVDSNLGIVEFYDKPRTETDDQPWKDVALAEALRRATRRPCRVFNDARALAEWEVRFGVGQETDTFAVLVVRRGIGAKFVRRGRVEDFPMEIGIFVPSTEIGLDETPPHDKRASIESESGELAVVKAVARTVASTCVSIEDAAAVAEGSDEALRIFLRAGQGLARGLAAVQAVVNPERWAAHGPAPLLDETRPAGRAFVQGLRSVSRHLHYEGLWPAEIRPRASDGRIGARAAALSVQVSDRTASTAGRYDVRDERPVG